MQYSSDRYPSDRFTECKYCKTQNPISRTFCYECTEILSSFMSWDSPPTQKTKPLKPVESEEVMISKDTVQILSVGYNIMHYIPGTSIYRKG